MEPLQESKGLNIVDSLCDHKEGSQAVTSYRNIDEERKIEIVSIKD